MLSPAQQLALPLEKHRNHYLFSDYYLNTLLPRQPDWREADVQAAQALRTIRQLYADRHALLRPNVGESALEDQWIRPILDCLGHTYHVQPSLPSPEGSRTPDYALFPDGAAYNAALSYLGTAEFFGTALAVADAKRWDRSLDRRLTDGAGDAFSNANPSYQIDYYLRITKRDWGLLTNGRLWRLYNRESSFRLDSYYEVDLISLLEQGQVEDFKYFYLFFRRTAFPEFLDRVLCESREYAQGVSADLKERIYEALRLLAEGFLKYPGTALTAADLKETHDNALILLYRLLFIFYAESRRLLPLENRSYAEVYSLKAVKEEIADRLNRKMIYLPRQATIWDNLKALFHTINEGSTELGVPAYNGRLFDPSKYPFLEKHTIGDAYLVQALDLLARTRGAQGLDFVDYRDLEIRHLGSIYEGLLEYQLRHADQDMAVVKDGKGERIVPAEEGQKVAFPTGSVYLVTDRGERKATGSYYTPDYIVKYIVENTVGPLVDEKQRAVQDRLADLEAKLKAARGENRELLERELVRERDRFGETVLELKVLDPAMGSGHFLVEATDYLAQRIVDFGVRLGAGAEGAKGPDETEISFWRRRAVESCIYGVDVNPLAVELAKLSLWLATAAKGKPLSFLDHHLRCGNSLIGARLEDLGSLPARKKGQPVSEAQMALFDESAFTQDMGLAVGGLTAIQALTSDSVGDIHQKERIFQDVLEAHLKRWRQIADLWVSTYFGNEMAPGVYADLMQRVQTGQGVLSDAQAQPYLDRAHALWQDKRFFHWELEFPEVFFDKYGRRKPTPGFDAVVGNPPWLGVRTGAIEAVFLGWLRQNFTSSAGQFDLAAVFLEIAAQFVRSTGAIGMVVPKRIATNESYAYLRKLVVIDRPLVSAVDLGVAFEGVDNDALVLVSGISHPPTTIELGKRTSGSTIKSWTIDRLATTSMPFHIIPVNSKSSAVTLVAKMSNLPVVHLGELVSITRGAECGMNHLAITQEPSINAIPLVDHLDVDRFSVTHSGWYVNPSQIPANVLKPLSLYTTVPKLLVRFLSAELIVGKDNVGYASTNLLYHLQCGAETDFLCSVLCSRLLSFWYRTAFQNEEVKFPHVQKSHLEFLPIRRIAFTTPQEERGRLGEIGITEATEFIEHTERPVSVSFSAFSISVLGRWLDARLPTKPDGSPDTVHEQSDVVHDLLAHLAGQMIEMYKAKNEETRGFLSWLAGYTGLPIEEWSLKTNIKAYYQYDWTEMRGVLDANRRQIEGVDVLGREAQERIQREYESSVGKLRPLLARIAATDRLIDLIVYRLYGLTEEEVAVVEGRA